MFLDAYGAPKDVTPDNLHDYTYDLHGVMLLTSADYELFIPPRWHGTIYSTEELLDSYRKRFKPDSALLTFHAMEPYEPELICCERCVVEITALPAGQTLYSSSEIVVFLVKIYEQPSLPCSHHERGHRHTLCGRQNLHWTGGLWRQLSASVRPESVEETAAVGREKPLGQAAAGPAARHVPQSRARCQKIVTPSNTE
ncbi:uncharacterized protein LOC111595853 isoform X2 [Drosophila hydei]|uniref:Uncharacterized protein LOC111595853 isoform X2 n=1 Tax=Drosophila hydei TaxID=7224 RepID=A0A6J1LIH8_DROHY|nr:uncharacterized protein LOC111595853 isoform X2 [Drosophila hydei]